MPPVIRPARVSDVAAVLALWREAGAQPSRTDDPKSLALLIDHDPDALIVAELNGQIVGSVIAAWDGWRGSIYRLAVAPAVRRTGLGTRLVSEAERRISQAGAVRIQAVVIKPDAHAVGFWRASGWEEQVEHVRFVNGDRPRPVQQ